MQLVSSSWHFACERDDASPAYFFRQQAFFETSTKAFKRK